MAIIASETITRFPFAQLPEYAGPNPEGMAVCHIDVTGDATGGAISGGIVSTGSFLYRLELFQITRGDSFVDDVDVVSIHQWATEKSRFPDQSFSLNWHLLQRIALGFGLFTLPLVDYQMIRRFPLGATREIGALNVLFYQNLDNIDTILYDIDAVFTYWRKEALLLPGFLQAYYETPFIPGGLPLGT